MVARAIASTLRKGDSIVARAQHYKHYKGEAAGLARGRNEGRAETLLKQLQLKFGRPSAATRQRVAVATAEQLDAWLEAVLTADSLDQVLASKPAH